MSFVFGTAVCCTAALADVCDPVKLLGPYAFQLSGITTISGVEKPTTSLGRLVFDGAGKVSGTASAMYTGLLLGNPVTGTYDAKSDCSLTWKLQDDSGAFQNFAGTISEDLSRVRFHQTDPGGATNGVMQRSAGQCSDTDVKPRYNYAVSGNTIAMQPGGTAGTVSAKGTLLAGENPVHVDSDCTVQFELRLRTADGGVSIMKMRGILVNDGKEILAMQTDPGAMVSGRFISDLK